MYIFMFLFYNIKKTKNVIKHKKRIKHKNVTNIRM